MASFDLYTFKYTQSEFFFRRPVEKNTEVWLDGIDGFYDQYFKGLQGIGKEEIRFVPVESLTAIPDEPARFEALPFIEVQIQENLELRARALIKGVTTLGEWSRTIELAQNETLDSVPAHLQPTPEVAAELRRKTGQNGSALWKSAARYWKKPSEVSSYYMFTHKEGMRCIILTTNAVPSYLLSV